MSNTSDRPREADARALHDEAVAEGWTVATAIEAAEARGLAPVGWSDGDAVGRGWWCYHCKGTGERNRGYKGCVACERPDTLQSTGATRQPATVRDLCAVLALGWNEGTREVVCGCTTSARVGTPVALDARGRVVPSTHEEAIGYAATPARSGYVAVATRTGTHTFLSGCPDCDGRGVIHVPRGHDAAEDLARQVAHELRAYGYTGQARRVVWRPVDVIRDALDTGPVWGEGQRTTLYADGRLRHTPDVNRPGEQRWTHLPAARALAAMGLRLGCVDDESVTLVVTT